MRNKILFGMLTLAITIAVIPMFAAFEAHVINVTATIENALRVNTDDIKFGTVFPQEHLAQPLEIALSQSFIDEDRVDDVEYIIRQKPKCGLTTENGTILIGYTTTGHVIVDSQGNTSIDCGPAPVGTDNQLIPGDWGVLPSLCEYISKEGEDQNDGTLASFHQPWSVISDATGLPVIQWNDVRGRLAKSQQDIIDTWKIDLAVPCFGEHCAQDWANFVHGINPVADPAAFVLDQSLEHKVFGCDLWVEVTGVSEKPVNE